MRVTVSAYLMLFDLIAPITVGEKYKLSSSSLRNFLRRLLLLPPWSTILLIAPFPNTSTYEDCRLLGCSTV
jgi:hypothetical protein